MPLLGVVPALYAEKRHAVRDQTLPSLLAHHPESVVACAGEGAARAENQAASRAAGMGEAVRFLGARDGVTECLHAFDVVALLSHPWVETSPHSLIEAIDSGRDVGATRVGSVEEFDHESVTRLLMPPAELGALAAALVGLLDHDTCRAAFGAAGRFRAAHFSLAATVARAAELLRAGI